MSKRLKNWKSNNINTMNSIMDKNGKIYLKDECAAGLLDTTVLPDNNNINCSNNTVNCINKLVKLYN